MAANGQDTYGWHLHGQGAIEPSLIAPAAGTLKGQGATQLPVATYYPMLRAQGATEYLVLLAVVLVIALVAIALLGFFPGMSGDTQETQSKMYWQSATPVSIVVGAAKIYASSGETYLYLRFKNAGLHPIRIIGIFGGDGAKITQFFSTATCGLNAGYHNISDHYYMGPDETKYFGFVGHFNVPCDRQVVAQTSTTSGFRIGGASSVCQNSATAPGMVEIKKFGFEYIEYVEGIPITKRQVGTAPLVIGCKI